MRMFRVATTLDGPFVSEFSITVVLRYGSDDSGLHETQGEGHGSTLSYSLTGKCKCQTVGTGSAQVT